jgi:hypothetical protein
MKQISIPYPYKFSYLLVFYFLQFDNGKKIQVEMLLKKRKHINKNEGNKLTTKKRKLWKKNLKERDELQDGELKVRKEAKSAEMLEENISTSQLESKQMQTNCAESRTGSELARKRKRPWRQMIRHQAKRERLALDHGDHEQKPGSEEPENGIDLEILKGIKKTLI